MGFDLYSRETASYFRLTTQAMWEYLDYFRRAGVIDDAAPPILPPNTPGLSAETPDWPHDAPFSDAELAALGFRSPDPRKLPAIKLFTNESWIVSGEECAILATICEAADADREASDDDFFAVLERFGEFCRGCEDEGGFWVL